jgi:hypothetical protein
MAKASLVSPGLRDATLRAIQDALAAHQELRRVEEERSMDIDIAREEGVGALQERVSQLQSNAHFSQQELDRLRATANQFAAQVQQDRAAQQAHASEATQELHRLRVVEREHVAATQALRQEMDIVNNSLATRERQQEEAFNQLGTALEEKLAEFAARLQAHIDALAGTGRIPTPPARPPPPRAAQPSGSAPPPPPPPRAPPSAASASYHHSSHHSSSKPSRKNKGKASAARSGDPNSGDESSSNDSDDSASSSSDSDLSDASSDFMRRRRRTTTSPPRLLFGYRTAAAATREPKANSPPYFRMKRGEDYRPYVEGCECYMILQASRFSTEKHRII